MSLKMILELVFLSCVISVNSANKKDVIRIIIDSDNPDYNMDKSKNIVIEINNRLNQSNENVAVIRGDDYVRHKMGSELNKQNQRNTTTTRNSYDMDEWHGGNIPRSIEETDGIWNGTRKHNVLLDESNTNHIFVDGPLNPYKNDLKALPIYARKQNNEMELKETNDHQLNGEIYKSNNLDTYKEKTEEKRYSNGEETDDLNYSINNRDEENKKFIFNSTVNVFDDVVKASSNGESGNLEYQERRDGEENDAQIYLADYSYSVSVQRRGSHYASGALVGQRWVLSTAAEFYNVRETIKLYQMRVGSSNCKKGGLVTAIQSITVHPHFAPGSPSYDIALLRSAEPVVTSEITPIAMTNVATGKVLRATYLTTYWPRIVVNHTAISPTAAERHMQNGMRVSIQKLVPFDKCQRKVARHNISLDENSLCLKPVKPHHSKCMPDAGAPVAGKDGLWGITSGWVSPNCHSNKLPTIFTRVATEDVRNWINEHIHL